MEIRQLRSFITVARLLSFNRAARKMHYAQSSVSAQIHALEEELGVKLFDRLGKTIVLTEAGERLIQYAEKIAALEEETRSELKAEGQPRGSLTVRMPESLGIYRFPPVIKEFVSKHPGVRLNFSACTHEGLQQDLRKGVTDLGFLMTESINDAELEAEVLGFEDIILVGAAGHPLTMKKRVQAKDLMQEIFLLSRVDCSYRRSFEQTLEAQGVPIQNPIMFNSVASLKECAIQGLGLTVLPKMAVGAEIASKKLAPVRWKDGQFEVAVLMVWYKERWISPKQRAFMATTRSVLRGMRS